MSNSEITTTPNIYGIETEYSALLTFKSGEVHELVGACHSADDQIALLKEPEKPGGHEIPAGAIALALMESGLIATKSGYLSNGARLYLDPSGFEYATAETTTAKDAVLRSFEGDKILLGVLRRLVEDNDVLESYQVNRKAVDHNRVSRGVHLNTLTDISSTASTLPPITVWLGALNVAKGALFGSGGLLLDEHGCTEFHHSPRLSVTDRLDANYAVAALRPLVRTPFKGDGETFMRVETVTSDALNFGWPLRASLVATNAVIGLIELGKAHGRLPVLQTGDQAIYSAHNVGQYGSQGIMLLEDNEGNLISRSAIDVIRQIAETALETHSQTPYLDKESVQVLDEVIEVGDKVAADPYSAAGQVESVSRKLAMEIKMEKDRLPIDSETMCRFDYAWDWVGGSGIAELLRMKGRGWQGFGALPSPSVEKRRLVTPPQDTRAKIRGGLIASHAGLNGSEWGIFDLGGEAGTAYLAPTTTEVPEDIVKATVD